MSKYTNEELAKGIDQAIEYQLVGCSTEYKDKLRAAAEVLRGLPKFKVGDDLYFTDMGEILNGVVIGYRYRGNDYQTYDYILDNGWNYPEVYEHYHTRAEAEEALKKGTG